MKLYPILKFFFIFTIYLSPSLALSTSCLDLFKKNDAQKLKTTSGFVESQGRRMYYRVDAPAQKKKSSDQQVYLLIHGLLANSEYLNGVSNELVAAGRTVLRVDLLGHGQSLVHSSNPTANLMLQAAAVSEIIKILNIGELTIYGHSLGGGVAIQTAARMAQVLPNVQINKLILDEPYLLPVDQWMAQHSVNTMSNAWGFNPMSMFNLFMAVGATTGRMILPGALAAAVRQNPELFAVEGLTPEQVARGALGVFPKEDIRGIAQSLKTPVELVVGSIETNLAPKALMDLLHGYFQIPLLAHPAIENTVGHHHPFTHPEQIARIILGLKPNETDAGAAKTSTK